MIPYLGCCKWCQNKHGCPSVSEVYCLRVLPAYSWTMRCVYFWLWRHHRAGSLDGCTSLHFHQQHTTCSLLMTSSALMDVGFLPEATLTGTRQKLSAITMYASLMAKDGGWALYIYGPFLFHHPSFIKHCVHLSLGLEETMQLKVCCLCLVSRRGAQIRSQDDFEIGQES